MVDVLGLNPEDYWTRERAVDYDSKRNIEKIQGEITLEAVRLLGLKKGLVLDAGCGTGFSTLKIKEAGLKVIGLDASESMCELARAKGLQVVKASFDKLPFEGEHFDGIISISSLQWSSGSYEDILEFYAGTAKEFSRVLKKGCKCVIQFYPSTRAEFLLVKNSFLRKFFVEEVNAWTGRRAKTFLLLKKRV